MTDRDFRNLYRHGFARVAACTLPVTMADPRANAAAILERARHMGEQGAAVALFPELSLTGYAIDDLLLQDVLLREVEAALVDLTRATADLLPLVVVGAPLRHRNRVYNCAVLLHRGEILGIAPKSYLPNYREFYEKRHFAAGAGIVDEWFRPTFAHGGAAEALDGHDLGALELAGQQQAGAGGVAVDDHRAHPAHPVLAAEVRAGQAQVVA